PSSEHRTKLSQDSDTPPRPSRNFGPLSINPAKLQRASHAIDGHDVSGDSIVHLVRLRVANDLIEALLHHVLQPLVHFVFAPEKALAVLDPLEIADGDSARISENVGNNEDSLFFDDRVGVGSSRAIRAFAENLAIDAGSVLGCNLVLGCGGHQNLAGVEQHFLRGHFFSAAGKIRERLPLVVDPVVNLGDIKTLLVVKPAVDVGHTDDFVSGCVHQQRALRADVAESLNDGAATLAFHSEFRECLVATHHHTSASGFLAALRTAQFQRLTGYYGSGRLPRVHGVGVH